MNNINPISTQETFNELLQHIQQARQKVFTQINTALIDLYWFIGKTISQKVKEEAWGEEWLLNFQIT